MSDYNARVHRLRGVTSRMRDVLASLEQGEQSRKEERAWLARNRGTLASWPAALSRYNLLRPSDAPISEARKFSRWARRQEWTNPTLLTLRWQCAWLLFRVRTKEAHRRMSGMVNRDAILVLIAILVLFGFGVLLFMS